jgi:hypothetical protein
MIDSLIRLTARECQDLSSRRPARSCHGHAWAASFTSWLRARAVHSHLVELEPLARGECGFPVGQRRLPRSVTVCHGVAWHRRCHIPLGSSTSTPPWSIGHGVDAVVDLGVARPPHDLVMLTPRVHPGRGSEPCELSRDAPHTDHSRAMNLTGLISAGPPRQLHGIDHRVGTSTGRCG